MYIEKMAPEESLYVGFSGARVTLHVHWDECCRKVVMMPAKTRTRRLAVFTVYYIGKLITTERIMSPGLPRTPP